MNDSQIASGPFAGSHFGSSVDVDGDWAVVGEPAWSTGGSLLLNGRAIIYHRIDPFHWVVDHVVEGPVPNAALGSGVAISKHPTLDQVVVVLGEPGNDAAIFHARNNGVWTSLEYLLFGGGTGGAAVAVSAELGIAAVGNPTFRGFTYRTGTVHVFPLSGGLPPANYFNVYPPLGSLQAEHFGTALAIERATIGGQTSAFLVVGAPDYLVNGSPPGRVFQYSIDPSVTTATLNRTVLSPFSPTLAGFGSALAFNSQGLVVGSPNYNTGVGMAFTFSDNGTTWVYSGAYYDPATGANTGASMALDGDRFAYGAPHGGLGGGGGALYTLSGTGLAALLPPTSSPGNTFGQSMAFSEGFVFVGDPTRDNGKGAVFVIRAKTIDCDNDNTDDLCQIAAQGASVDCNGDWILDTCQPYQVTQNPPAIIEVDLGATLSITGSAQGAGPVQYQWRHNGTPLVDGGRVSGSTTPSLQVTSVVSTDDGVYDFVASNACGSVTSSAGFVRISFGTSFCSGDGWYGASYSALGQGLTTLAATAQVNALASYDPQTGGGAVLYAGGDFAQSGSTSMPSIAKLTATGWQALGASISTNGSVRALEVFDLDGTGPIQPLLVAGGTFTTIGSVNNMNRVAAWNGTSWSNLSSGLNGAVNALLTYDPDGAGPQPAVLYAGGVFNIGGPSRHVAQWNGSSWSGVGTTPLTQDIVALAMFDDGAGARLYAASVGPDRLYQLDASGNWNQIATFPGPINALAAYDQDGPGGPFYGYLYIGGAFQGGNGDYLTRWTGTAILPFAGGTLNGPVTALKPITTSTGLELFIGGSFTAAGPYVARGLVDYNGLTFAAQGAGVSNVSASPGVVRAIQVHDPDGAGPLPSLVHLAGQFDQAQSSTVNNTTRIDPVPGAKCPCSNWGLPGRGCAHSVGPDGARLIATGHPSLAGDTVVLTARGLSGPGLFFQGTAQMGGGFGIPFGDGILCAGGTITRMGVVFPTGSGPSSEASYPGGLTPNLVHIAGGVGAPGTFHYQVWYRDANVYCTAQTYNLTQGLTIGWTP